MTLSSLQLPPGEFSVDALSFSGKWILRAAFEFSGGEGKMRDNLTLVVARAR